MKCTPWRGCGNLQGGVAAVLFAIGWMVPHLGWSYDSNAAVPPTNKVAPSRSNDVAAGSSATVRYVSVAIVQPGEQVTVHDNSDSLTVEVATAPALDTAAGDQIVVLLDGVAAATQAANRFHLSNVMRGTHTAKALIVDRHAQTLATSSPVTFYMWHASRLFPNRTR